MFFRHKIKRVTCFNLNQNHLFLHDIMIFVDVLQIHNHWNKLNGFPLELNPFPRYLDSVKVGPGHVSLGSNLKL